MRAWKQRILYQEAAAGERILGERRRFNQALRRLRGGDDSKMQKVGAQIQACEDSKFCKTWDTVNNDRLQKIEKCDEKFRTSRATTMNRLNLELKTFAEDELGLDTDQMTRITACIHEDNYTTTAEDTPQLKKAIQSVEQKRNEVYPDDEEWIKNKSEKCCGTSGELKLKSLDSEECILSEDLQESIKSEIGIINTLIKLGPRHDGNQSRVVTYHKAEMQEEDDDITRFSITMERLNPVSKQDLESMTPEEWATFLVELWVRLVNVGVGHKKRVVFMAHTDLKPGNLGWKGTGEDRVLQAFDLDTAVLNHVDSSPTDPNEGWKLEDISVEMESEGKLPEPNPFVMEGWELDIGNVLTMYLESKYGIPEQEIESSYLLSKDERVRRLKEHWGTVENLHRAILNILEEADRAILKILEEADAWARPPSPQSVAGTDQPVPVPVPVPVQG